MSELVRFLRVIREQAEKFEDLTDWERLDAMTDAEIDLSDCPEITPEMLAKVVVRRGLKSSEKNADNATH